jgi:hypothetical protein
MHHGTGSWTDSETSRAASAVVQLANSKGCFPVARYVLSFLSIPFSSIQLPCRSAIFHQGSIPVTAVATKTSSSSVTCPYSNSDLLRHGLGQDSWRYPYELAPYAAAVVARWDHIARDPNAAASSPDPLRVRACPAPTYRAPFYAPGKRAPVPAPHGASFLAAWLCC